MCPIISPRRYKLDIFQRRRILHCKWSDEITNEDLYSEAEVIPGRQQVLEYRWNMFGHLLCLNENDPVRKAMKYYFNDMRNDC